MASKTVKLLINSAEFPFTYAYASRSTIQNEDIAARMPGFTSGARTNMDYGAPQLLYCENVLPFAKGLYSIGYTQQVAAHASATNFDQCIPLRDSQERVFPFVPARGANYVLDPVAMTWSSVSPITFTNTLVTHAYVEGRTFICYEMNKIIEYDADTNTFVDFIPQLPAPYTMLDIRGIGAASNYLLLFTSLSVLWNAPLDLTEFADVDEGAGEQTPVDIKGQIVALLPAAGGFIIYTTRNAIGATFTNDAGSPFMFREIVNCGGIASGEVVTSDSDDAGHYLWGTHGLQRITLNQAATDFPAVTDFLAGKQTESWNPATKRVDLTSTSAHLAVKLSFLLGRYLCISYGLGTTTFDYALIFDTALGRWGRLKIEHCDAFSYPYPSGAGMYDYNELPGYYDGLTLDYLSLDTFYLATIPVKQGMAFLKTTGEVQMATLDFAQTDAPGVIVLGHIQQRHDRMITITDIELDGIRAVPEPEVTIISSETGLTKTASLATTAGTSSGNYRNYKCRQTAKNFDIAVEGTMMLSSALVSVVHNGAR